jgi:hypothetical protein
MTYNFEDYKSNTLTRPRDEAWSNWKSWKDSEIGDKVQGFVADAFYRPEEKNPDGSVAFRSQRGITIRQADGKLINVGVKDISFILAPTDNLKVGDPLTIELSEIAKPQSKGKQGAKIFSYYGTNLPENKDNKSVKELTDEDRLAGGSQAPDEEVATEEEAF